MGADRPFRRKIWKLATRVLFGKRRAHAQDWLPNLRVERDESGHFDGVIFRGERVAGLCKLHVLKERAGDEIFVVGSGPSIGSLKVDRIPPRAAILLNGAMDLIGRGVVPLAVAVEDERFVYRHFRRFMETLDREIVCLLSTSALRAICELDRVWLQNRDIILIDNIAKPYGADARGIDSLKALPFVRIGKDGAGFSLDPEKGVFQGGSVATSATQFAVACAPGLIGFLGVDISNAGQPRFYEDGRSVAFSGIVRAQDRILRHIALARDVAAEQGIRFENFSPPSALSQCGIPFSGRFSD
ncbi:MULTISPECIES: hypothetical protein [unclassified Rhizobium]|uniref:hypothetical protein n=1 Tax=unclassified Rhizobium TaxID=2613769 RepID=UPI0006FA51CF|nr:MULTISPECIES: hypothetical protein [unclassified Rhizobium]KQV38328.1 hypothetical protein ASC86_08905 [Rhizobium sp. Root1212]KRD30983.1 hypothetical protein ASE37_08895 [Rhizobium sp. Root268]